MDTQTAHTETAHLNATHRETAHSKEEIEDILSKLLEVCMREYAEKHGGRLQREISRFVQNDF